jgi:excisionase family DNA binding protein
MLDLEKMYLRPKDVAAELGISDSAVYKMLDRGVLPSVRLEGSRRIPSPAFQAWLRARDSGVWTVASERDTPSAATPFTERVGRTPEEFIARWKSGEIPDTGETTALLIEALSERDVDSSPQVYKSASSDNLASAR